FPRTVCSVMAVLGACLTYHGYRKRNEENQKVLGVSLVGLKYIGVTFAILVVYVLSLYFLPYVVSTAIGLFLLIFFYGQRNWIKLIGVSVGLPLIIYLSFTYLLMLKLP
ncbi:MAG: tripartite tricarboxylate transporter TctB family protein, partial [Firmicutes bacterium]|nr:tripartite tricarboxylate transporter TctB family protein [Bacillota bacterium]